MSGWCLRQRQLLDVVEKHASLRGRVLPTRLVAGTYRPRRWLGHKERNLVGQRLLLGHVFRLEKDEDVFAVDYVKVL
jgi:hypothetical protein